MADQSMTLKFRVITHGNNGIRSSQLFNQLQVPQKDDIYETDTFDFFPFDLDVNRRIPLFELHNGMQTFTEESENVSAILVFINQTEIFSEGMHSLILRIPHNKFYGFNRKNEHAWWKRVIVVFWFGEYEGGEEKIQQSIARNRGIKEIVRKAGNRYTWVSANTSIKQFTDMVQSKLEQFGEQKVKNMKKARVSAYEDDESKDRKERRLLLPKMKTVNYKCCIISLTVVIVIVVVLEVAAIASLIGVLLKKDRVISPIVN